MGLLTEEQKKRLLEIARQTIKYKLEKGKDLKVDEVDETLNRKMGAFVTLHEDGQLRGCIGNLIGSKALYLTIQEMALEAAFRDPRFTSLKLKELNKIEIEISVLSPLEKVDSCEDIILGTHGVLIQKGMRSGVFLPQVAEETGWSKEEFLSCLCSHKAGLPPDAWKDPATEMYAFTAEIFSEKNL